MVLHSIHLHSMPQIFERVIVWVTCLQVLCLHYTLNPPCHCIQVHSHEPQTIPNNPNANQPSASTIVSVVTSCWDTEGSPKNVGAILIHTNCMGVYVISFMAFVLCLTVWLFADFQHNSPMITTHTPLLKARVGALTTGFHLQKSKCLQISSEHNIMLYQPHSQTTEPTGNEATWSHYIRLC